MKQTQKTTPAIEVVNVTKSFKIPLEHSGQLKQKVVNALSKKKGYREFTPLNDVSFTVNKGDFFGIVGKNGSGKSTLLKTIAGIYSPNKGAVNVHGSLVPFIELGVGFNPELTGRENVFLNGALLGFSHAEVAAMYDEIVTFAELGEFMDERLKNYSSGMQVRLAFSIAIRAESDILLLDEVLAVGDANFQAKCLAYFHELKKFGRTVVFISHDMNAVQEFCNRVVVLDKGKITFDGDPREAASLYNVASFESQGAKEEVTDGITHRGTGDVVIERAEIIDGLGKKPRVLKPNQHFSINLKLKVKTAVEDMLVGVQVLDAAGAVMFSANNRDALNDFKGIPAGKTLNFKIELENLFNNGTYFVAAAVKSLDRTKIYDEVSDIKKFNVAGWDVGGGVHITHKKSVTVEDTK